MNPTNRKEFTELNSALSGVRDHFIYAALFSAAINTLALVPIIYMLQVYDRVVSSGSHSTLAMLTILMVALLCAMGGFEWVRSLILISASNKMEGMLRKRVSEVTFKRALLTGGAIKNSQPLTDLQALRSFVTGGGLFAFFDAPWFPIYIGVMYLFHPLFAFAGVFAGAVMVAIALFNERATSKKIQEANSHANSALSQVNDALQNSEVIAAMGMESDLRLRQQELSDKALGLQMKASRLAAAITSVSKTFRLVMQSLLLGLGALLALTQEISPGMMIAGSLLLGRALAPIDLLVANWKGFSIARGQYDRLGVLLKTLAETEAPMGLPEPKGALSVEQITVFPPGGNAAVLAGISFKIAQGESLGIIGPSGSGKSCLARTLLGIWPPRQGKVRLDGSDTSGWDREKLGPHIGYLPQNIELFNGSISENICRFSEIDPEKIILAAKSAGVHDLILALPKGYDTEITGSTGLLSGGHRQRIGLARALYDNPKFLVLDEPNSNLDDQGEKELIKAINVMASRGTTIVAITHRTALLQSLDKILVMSNGLAKAFGPREDVLKALATPANSGAN